MRFTSFISLCALLGLTAACGASDEAISPGPGIQNEAGDPKPVDLEREGTLMAPKSEGDFDDNLEALEDDDDYFGDETEIIDERGVAPEDRVTPRTDLSETETTGTSRAPADRIQPAPIGDPRLQAEDGEEELPESDGPETEQILDDTTPSDHP